MLKQVSQNKELTNLPIIHKTNKVLNLPVHRQCDHNHDNWRPKHAGQLGTRIHADLKYMRRLMHLISNNVRSQAPPLQWL